jgi:hypothetical protein
MPACPLLTLRRPPREGPTHNSESWLIAIHYHVVDFHHLLYAGFYRRFLGVPPRPLSSFLMPKQRLQIATANEVPTRKLDRPEKPPGQLPPVG